MKTIKNMKRAKPLPKQQQKKVNGGTTAMESLEAEDTSKPRPPMIILTR